MARIDRFDGMSIKDNYTGKYRFATQHEYTEEIKYREDKMRVYKRSISEEETQRAGIKENRRNIKTRIDNE